AARRPARDRASASFAGRCRYPYRESPARRGSPARCTARRLSRRAAPAIRSPRARRRFPSRLFRPYALPFPRLPSTCRAAMSEPLTFAVPKGRILDEALPVMARAGLVPESAFHDKGNRALAFACDGGGIRLIRVRAFDVATFVAFGAAQAGVVGSDVIEEFEF